MEKDKSILRTADDTHHPISLQTSLQDAQHLSWDTWLFLWTVHYGIHSRYVKNVFVIIKLFSIQVPFKNLGPRHFLLEKTRS